MHELREFMFERVYLRPETEQHRRRAMQIVHELVRFFDTHPDKIPGSYRLDDVPTLTQAIDYVAGMTDRFAIRTHQELLGG